MPELRETIAELKAEMSGRFTRVDGELRLLRWMVGTTFAAVVAVLIRVFFP